ncbi:MAG: hypothetical protein ABIG20_00770 [archaeon]
MTKNTLLITVLFGVILFSGCVQEQEPDGPATGGASEIWIQPAEITIYDDYLTVIQGRVGSPHDLGTIEATIVSIVESEVCPYTEEDCSMETYPKDAGIIRIDKIVEYTSYSEQLEDQPVEESADEVSEEGVISTPGSPGIGVPAQLPEYEQLAEDREVSAIFVLTTRPVKVNYISVEPSTGGPESATSGTESATDVVSHSVDQQGAEPLQKVFKPIPKQGNYFVFTTKILPYPQTSQKTLPGLEVGSKFRAEIEYDGTVFIEEYSII